MNAIVDHSKEKDALSGLNCPNCGGVVPVPEGQAVVRCPYCDLRSYVRGERGVRRYQVESLLSREDAPSFLSRFLSRNMAIASDAQRSARIDEVFLAYLPFWTVWGRVAAYAFGQKKVGSGDKSRYEPREIQVVEEMSWNGAACDVGEFGVNAVPLTNQPLVPFNPELLHAAGLVFEPVGSFIEAQKTAETDFENRVLGKTRLERLSQRFVRLLRRRFGLVYYPLLVLRYLYHGRAFQLVLDGYSGQVLYGKAPGNTLYRAAVLVLGMALGAFLTIDVAGLLLYFGLRGDSDDIGGVALVAGLVGLGIMAAAYRAFRYGEQYEYRYGRSSILKKLGQSKEFDSLMGEAEKWLER